MSALPGTLPYLFAQTGSFPAPFEFVVPASLEVQPTAATATFDGTNAGGTFLACLSFYSQSGQLLSRVFPSTQVAAGDVAQVSYAPFPGGLAAGSGVTSVDTTDGGTSVAPTVELLIGSGLTLTNPSAGVAEIVAQTPGPNFSGSTIVPLPVVVSTRAVQPDVAHFGVAHFGFRTIIPRSGTLHDLAIYVGTATANCEVAILDTAATTRTILYKSGLVSTGAGDEWLVVADPAMAVEAGDQYDIVCGFDANPSALVFWVGGLVNAGFTNANSAQLPAGFIPAPGGGLPRLMWQDMTSPVPYGTTTTVSESDLLNQVGVPLVIARIA